MLRHPSRDLFGVGFFLTDADINWFLGHYQPDPELRADPRVSVLRSEHLAEFLTVLRLRAERMMP